jgi:co-chaperonin GroES (HSP10)
MGKYTPTKGYLLVKPLEVTHVKGIDIEDDEQNPQLAKVVKVGKPTWYENSDRVFKAPCKVGDTIIHSMAGFENIKIDSKDYRAIHFSKVLVVKK